MYTAFSFNFSDNSDYWYYWILIWSSVHMTKNLKYSFMIHGRILNSAIQFPLTLLPNFSGTPL